MEPSKWRRIVFAYSMCVSERALLLLLQKPTRMRGPPGLQ
jgi:hypothetical protein